MLVNCSRTEYSARSRCEGVYGGLGLGTIMDPRGYSETNFLLAAVVVALTATQGKDLKLKFMETFVSMPLDEED